MAVCIGLSLGVVEGGELLEKAGYKLGISPLHLAYKKLLTDCVGYTLHECDELLAALSMPTFKNVASG
jgi:hypothetical protein